MEWLSLEVGQGPESCRQNQKVQCQQGPELHGESEWWGDRGHVWRLCRDREEQPATDTNGMNHSDTTTVLV